MRSARPSRSTSARALSARPRVQRLAAGARPRADAVGAERGLGDRAEGAVAGARRVDADDEPLAVHPGEVGAPGVAAADGLAVGADGLVGPRGHRLDVEPRAPRAGVRVPGPEAYGEDAPADPAVEGGGVDAHGLDAEVLRGDQHRGVGLEAPVGVGDAAERDHAVEGGVEVGDGDVGDHLGRGRRVGRVDVVEREVRRAVARGEDVPGADDDAGAARADADLAEADHRAEVRGLRPPGDGLRGGGGLCARARRAGVVRGAAGGEGEQGGEAVSGGE